MASRSKEMEVTAVFEKRGGWYIGYVAEVPGVNVQERTLRQAKESLRIALDELASLAPAQVRGRARRIERVTIRV